jgi:hypothetical protein
MANVVSAPLYEPSLDDDYIWRGPLSSPKGFNLALATTVLPKTVLRPAFYAPRPSDDFIWQGPIENYNSVAIQLLTYQKFFGAGGQPPTKRWHYDNDDEATIWRGPLDNYNSNVLVNFTAVKFFGARGQAPTKFWAPYYNYDVGEASIWQGTPENYNSGILEILTRTKFFGAPGQVPTERWGVFYNYDDFSGWQFNPKGHSPLQVSEAFVNAPWLWKFDYDTAESAWQGTPETYNSGILQQLTAADPFEYQPWAFGYSDDSTWQGPLGNYSAGVLKQLIAVKFFGAPGQAPTKFWHYDYTFDEIVWRYPLKPATFNTLLTAAGPFEYSPWKYHYDVAELAWVGTPTSSQVLPVLTVGGQVKPSRWANTIDDSAIWQQPPAYNVNFLTTILPKTVLRPPFIAPRPADDFVWQSTIERNTNLFTAAVANPFTYYPWKFGLDDSSGWQWGAKGNALLLPGLTAQFQIRYWNNYDDSSGWQFQTERNANVLAPVAVNPFTSPPWKFGTDDYSLWTGKSGSNQPLIAQSAIGDTFPFITRPFDDPTWQFKTPYNFSLAANLQFPTVQLGFENSPDDNSVWQVTLAGKNINLTPGVVANPFTYYPWKFGLDDSSGWQGVPSPSVLLVPILTAGGKAPIKLWRWDHDVGESAWAAVPRSSVILVPELAKQPFTYYPWKFGLDDSSGWQWGATPRANSTLFIPIPTFTILSRQWLFGYDDFSNWQFVAHKNPNLSTPAVTPFFSKAWHYDYDDSSGWQFNPPPRSPLQVSEAFVNTPWLWKFDYDDSSGWQFTPKGHSPLQVSEAFVNTPWLWKFDYDDSSGWQFGSQGRNPNLVLAPLIPPLWKFNYDDSSGWQFSSKGSSLLAPVLTAQASAPAWKFVTRPFDDPTWQFQGQTNINVTTRPTVVTPPILNWNYNNQPDDSPAWQGFYWRNDPLLFPRPVLITDPRFISFGRPRIVVISGNAPKPVSLFPTGNTGAARTFVTTPTVPGMPYGNDLSVIDPAVETVTVTFNFDPWLAAGVTISSVVSVTAVVSKSSLAADPNPQNIITGLPQIGPVPPAFPGTPAGAANRAVLQQVTNCQPGVTYLLQCLILTSDSQELNLATKLPCLPLN